MSNDRSKKKLKVAVVGGGLVGALQACYSAKRGHDVELYELRDDIRLMEHVPGKSINLAMSIRARTALREVGLEDAIIRDHGLPMEARMIHRTDGTTYSVPYGKKGQCIYSVGRRFVNEVLLNAAEKYPNVNFNFRHKLITADLDRGSMTFENKNKEVVESSADVIFGTDGAFSAIRKQFMKKPRFNFSQEYIPSAYLELCIPPTSAGEFAMDEKHLHIWPRGSFMMIALPNQDRTWTVTLFMPWDIFDTLDSPENLIKFFETYYADTIPLIGKDRLIKDYFSVKPLPLLSVKCNPYNVGGRAVLMGDSAHAMVPFYGQGMNAGMEDCYVLNELMDQYGDENLDKVLPAFSEFRSVDGHAICDLAMYNYIEMRDLVNQWSFLLRKRFDNAMHSLFPDWWVPLYTSVTFSRMRYHHCILNKKWQDQVVRTLLWSTGAAVTATATAACVVFRDHLPF